MADEECKRLLQEWDLPDVIDIFRDNGITKPLLKDLTSDLIKELLPLVGMRMRFTMKWQDHFNKNINNEEGTDSSQHSSDHDDTSSESSTDIDEEQGKQLTRQKCFYDQKTYEAASEESKSSTRIRSILNSSIEGRGILRGYKKSKTLSRKCRQTIAEVVISSSLKDPHSVLRNTDFQRLAEEIVNLFPTENIKSYYIPPIKKQFSRTHKSICSSGKLVDKYRNKLRDFRKLSGLVKSTTEPCTSTTAHEDDTQMQQSVSWLCHNREPWDSVQQHWLITAPLRLVDTGPSKNVSDIYVKWPVLKDPLGYTLIEKDFEALKICQNVNVIDNWVKFFDALIKSVPLSTTGRASSLCKLLDDNNITAECKVIAQILLLPILIPPKGRIRVKKQHWKPSLIECEESIIQHAKIPGDIQRLQDDRREKMRQFGLTVQPFIIVVGPTVESVDSVYVSIDETVYKLPTALRALDICFKAFHALNACYPPESEHLWYIIQRSVYKFSTQWDKPISYVMELLPLIQKHME